MKVRGGLNFLSVPDLPKGQTTNALFEFVDIYPALSELSGLPVPHHVKGDSFVPLMNNPGQAWKKAALCQYPRSQNRKGYTMKTDQYRYTEWATRDGNREILARELYDHATDPAESINVVEDPVYQTIEPDLAAMMHAGWQHARPSHLTR